MEEKFINKFFNGWIRWLRFHQVLKIIPADTVVYDLGCGDCAFLKHISGRIKRGIGVDITVDKQNCENEKITVIKSDLNAWKFPQNETADIVTMVALIEHLSDPASILKESYNILNNRGKMIITTPTKRAKPILEFMAFKLDIIKEQDIRDHKVYYTKDSLKTALIKAGFPAEKISIKYFEFGLNMLAVAEK